MTSRVEVHPVLSVIFLLGLPIVAGMAVLGAMLCVLKALWLRLTQEDRLFEY